MRVASYARREIIIVTLARRDAGTLSSGFLWSVQDPGLSKMQEFIRQLFSDPQMLRMGHAQRSEDLNLGLGWIYYGLARLIRPQVAVVIGSYRGFVPAIMARAMGSWSTNNKHTETNIQQHKARNKRISQAKVGWADGPRGRAMTKWRPNITS